MNIKNDQSHQQMPLSDEHEAIVDLLDGYSRDTLVAQEKRVVEQHLVSCQECQDDTAASKPLTVQWPLSRLTRSRSHKTPRNRGRWLVGLVAASICVVVLGVLCFPAISQLIFMSIQSSRVQSTAVTSIWSPSQTQMPVIRQGQNVFAVEHVALIDNRDFDFIYAFRSSHSEVRPQVNVISKLSSQPTSSITIKSTVQKLGILGDFEIGEIQAHIQDHVGQTIVVQGTFPDQTTPWHLTICSQSFPLRPADPSSADGPYSGGSIAYQNALPEITVNIPTLTKENSNLTSNVYGYTHQVGLISLTSSSSQKLSTLAAPMYMRLDYLWKNAMVKATLISQAEYLRLAGPEPTPSP
jgi:hypothetical protein